MIGSRRGGSGRSPSAGRLARLSLTALATALLAGAQASANDSTAELATGGLRLTVSPDVELRAEDLYISRKRVEVNYRFFNRSPRDVRTIVAFPLPVEPPDGGDDENVAEPAAEPGNPWGFHAWSDGRPVPARLMRQATLKKEDNTAQLEALHLPLDPVAKATLSAVKRLSAADRDRLVRLGLLRGGRPAWALQPTYVWTQVFPAGREVTVRHVYAPSVGNRVETPIGGSDPAEAAVYAQNYCPDAALNAAIARFKAAHAERPPPEDRIDYVLHTGANWATPIGRFHLTLDKGAPRTLISVCLQGLRKTSATRFELERRNFRPAGDLRILFLNGE